MCVLKYWDYLVQVYARCERNPHLLFTLAMELNRGKTPIKWVNVLLTIHIELISII
jgi:hypothetical protein